MTTQNATAASAMENQKFLDTNADQKNGTASTTNSELSQTDFRSTQPAGDTALCKEYRTSRVEAKVVFGNETMATHKSTAAQTKKRGHFRHSTRARNATTASFEGT
jgi:hypothetical protein